MKSPAGREAGLGAASLARQTERNLALPPASARQPSFIAAAARRTTASCSSRAALNISRCRSKGKHVSVARTRIETESPNDSTHCGGSVESAGGPRHAARPVESAIIPTAVRRILGKIEEPVAAQPSQQRVPRAVVQHGSETIRRRVSHQLNRSQPRVVQVRNPRLQIPAAVLERSFRCPFWTFAKCDLVLGKWAL